MGRKVSETYFKKVAKELKGNGAAIARRIGRSRQAVNRRMHSLGIK